MGRPLRRRQENQGEWYNFGISFFLAGDSSYLVLKLQRLRPRGHIHEIYSSFVRGISLQTKFFRAKLFHSDATFRYYVVGVHSSP